MRVFIQGNWCSLDTEKRILYFIYEAGFLGGVGRPSAKHWKSRGEGEKRKRSLVLSVFTS